MAWWEHRAMASILRCNTTSSSLNLPPRISISTLLVSIPLSKSYLAVAMFLAKFNMVTRNQWLKEIRSQEGLVECKCIPKVRSTMSTGSRPGANLETKSERASYPITRGKEKMTKGRSFKSPGQGQWLPSIWLQRKYSQQYVVFSTRSMPSR